MVYTDNFFSSPALFGELKSLGFEACGTVRLNRTGLTKTFKIKDNLPKGKNYIFNLLTSECTFSLFRRGIL